MHPKTIERAARIICDLDGPYEKTGRQLADLLRSAGWHEPPEYDGGARVPWLVEAMQDRQGDQAVLERLLCQACHPVEYDDGMVGAEAMREALNGALEAEGLAITSWHGKPVMARAGQEGAVIFTVPEDLEPRLRALISDQATVEWLLSRIRETELCESSGAYVFALVGIGSFVEYLLLSVLAEWDEDIRANGVPDGGRRITLSRASLELLIRPRISWARFATTATSCT
jgi:hypothetical protein